MFDVNTGMRHTVHVKDMIGYLKRWCVKVSENPSEDPEGADFTTTVNHIHTVYRYLSAECTSTELRDLFQHAPAVFIEYDRSDIQMWDLTLRFLQSCLRDQLRSSVLMQGG